MLRSMRSRECKAMTERPDLPRPRPPTRDDTLGVVAALQAQEADYQRRRADKLAEGNALIMHALDRSLALTDAVIAWLPEGQALPPNLGALKQQLDQALENIGVRR